MPTQTYEQAVAEAANALANGEQADWRVAQLTHDHTNRNRGGPATAGRVSMERWCSDVQGKSSVRLRFGPATGYRYARLWARYSEDLSQAPSFKDAYAEVDGTPDRERMMQYEAVRLLREGSPELKQETAVALLRDPTVREVAHNVGTTLGAVVHLVGEEAKEQRKREGIGLARDRDERTQRDPVLKSLDQSKAQTELINACFDFAKRVAALLPRIDHLPAPEADQFMTRHFLRLGTAQARGAVDQVDDLLATGVVGGGMDDFLASVLKAGQEKKEKGGAQG